MDSPFDPAALDRARLNRIANEIELNEAIEKAIELCKEFTVRLEHEKPVVRCLTAVSINKVYLRYFPKIYEAFEKLGI